MEAVFDVALLLDVCADTPGRQVAVRPLAKVRREENAVRGGDATHAQTRGVLIEISVTFLSFSDIFSIREAGLSLKGHGST